MNEPVPGRRWRFLDWHGKWIGIAAMSENTLVLETGIGVVWRDGHGWMPDTRLQFSYTVPFGDGEMPWRQTDWRDLPLIAQDMGHPELMGPIRDAMCEARRERRDE